MKLVQTRYFNHKRHSRSATSLWYTVHHKSSPTHNNKMEQLSYIPVFQSIIINLQPRDLSNFVLSSRKFVRLTENKGVMEEYRKKYHETILKAFFLNDFFKGLIITTKHKIEYSYDDEQDCCENFDVWSVPENLSLIGRSLNFDKMDLMLIEEECDDNLLEKTVYALVFPLDHKEELRIYFSNRHNGCYAHNLDVKINGKLKWNVAF